MTDTNSIRVIDFTENRWGHALHGNFMYPKEADDAKEKRKDKKLKRRRYTVPCHVSPFPREGDKIRYRAERGIVEAQIVHVKHYNDPRDMFDLEIVVTP